MSKKLVEKPIVQIKVNKEFQLPLSKYANEQITQEMFQKIDKEYKKFKRIKSKVEMSYTKYRRLIMIIESQYLYLIEQCYRQYAMNNNLIVSDQPDIDLLKSLNLSEETAKNIMETYTLV